MVIQTSSFRFRYPGATQPAVRGLTFAVAQGEIFGFLGPSGAGKSTTQNVLIRLLDGYEGAVTVLGRDLRAWDRHYYRRIGVSFESPNHYLKLTARENLRLFAGLHSGVRVDPDGLLERVGLIEDADKRVGEFSKGMRGRLTLARALLHRPELLFLDEPTAGLDPEQRLRFRELLSAVAARSTVLLSTHQTDDVAALCNRVVVLLGGSVQFTGTPAELAGLAGARVWMAAERDPRAQLAWITGDGMVRHIGDPPAGADLVAPTVEDGYLTLTGATAGVLV
jgi:fluoroquinolone transport system ATP-binding protein